MRVLQPSALERPTVHQLVRRSGNPTVDGGARRHAQPAPTAGQLLRRNGRPMTGHHTGVDGTSLAGIVVLSGWSATFRLAFLLAGPAAAVVALAPSSREAVALPLAAGVLWSLRSRSLTR
ncbi:hypothetical protein [Amycolatopsis tucumanensis]|uniref:hypothetical protein n=1 Tax=Amycolatopsis tucumanensis TaxID=401106 RepID=UPI001F2C1F2C|nr:hypothetical protein [Amycolatopsis tucumanensis]MCF6426714.1 hypothetical protein [Amycolatopsis tucumanensis]